MKSRLLGATVILIAAVASAQSADKLKDLQPFVGTWKCSGMAFASPMGPEHPTRATATAKWSLNNKWVEVHYTETKTSKNPHPYDVVAYWGYDDETKKLVADSFDNMGGYSTEDSPGWDGDQLVFSGPSHGGGMTMQGRDVFIRKGVNQFTHHFEMQDKSGGWQKTDEETCKR
jgi:hypothetical protein